MMPIYDNDIINFTKLCVHHEVKFDVRFLIGTSEGKWDRFICFKQEVVLDVPIQKCIY